MNKAVLIIVCSLLLGSEKNKTYLIVSGDLTCKACVIQLHNYLSRKVKKKSLFILLEDKGNFLLNQTSSTYLKSELPAAIFIFSNKKELFPSRKKYPYLIRIYKGDTTKIIYDSLFTEENLNTRQLE